ncbi:FecR domain-containing protein [Bremerella sp. JC770]|uniref:FecR domain-containing protein n=1 Tax=Bremerella sp. JC770 TaxID=3232137 RepID=UPI003459B5C7
MASDPSTPNADQRRAVLTDAWLSNSITKLELRELEGLLANDPDARQRFAEMVQLHEMLLAEHAHLGASTSPNPTVESQPISFLSMAIGFALAACLAFAAAIAWQAFSHPSHSEPSQELAATPLATESQNSIEPSRQSRSLEVPAVGSLVYLSPDAKLSPLTTVLAATGREEQRPRIGARLLPGELELTEGAMRLTLDHGAYVMLEAPTRLVLQRDMDARIDHGRLTAFVPSAAEGFTVIAKDFRVIDKGTQFGVECDLDGSSEVHVFDGAVELEANGERNLLLAGTARRMQDAEMIADIAVDGQRFGIVPKDFGQRGYYDDFSSDTSTNYRLTQGTVWAKEHGDFQIADGKLSLTPAMSNTMTVMLDSPGHGLWNRYRFSVEFPEIDVNDRPGQFLVVSTWAGQPDAESSYGFRFRRDASGLHFSRYDRPPLGSRLTPETPYLDPGGPLKLIVERVTPSRFVCYYQQPGKPRVFLDLIEAPDLAGIPCLFVGVQAWRHETEMVHALDEFRLEPID